MRPFSGHIQSTDQTCNDTAKPSNLTQIFVSWCNMVELFTLANISEFGKLFLSPHVQH